ncbi:MAG: NADH-ubiquinone oxidoreductase-F iron-sulfur binding region domain-containing protein [Magnetovibrionaceae bacterium]
MSGQPRQARYPLGRQPEDAEIADIAALFAESPPARHELIEALHRLNDRDGSFTRPQLAALARLMGLSQAEVYEVATFYHHFHVVEEDEARPPSRVVRVCDGLVCEAAGALGLKKSLIEASVDDLRVEFAPCMGACHRAPAANACGVQVDEATLETVQSALKETPIVGPPAPQPLDRWSALREGSLAIETVFSEITESDLRGMGGAGFPVARKWAFLVDKPTHQHLGHRHLVVNADEGEPGTFKDRWILENEPYRFLEGALIAATAVKADTIWIYLRDEYPRARAILTEAIARIAGQTDEAGISIRLRRGAGAYICGEESALLESLEGKRGLPRHKPPFPADQGLFGEPTLVHNVETLWWIPEILERGGAWFRAQGENGAHGLRLYSLSGRVREPGVKRAPNGITTAGLIERFGGGMAEGHRLRAFLPGGASGGMLPAELADQPLAFGALEALGCFVGSGAVIVLSDQDDLKPVLRNLMAFFADESCGQCTPCRLGTEKALRLMAAEDWDESLLCTLSEVMAEASICGLGQAAGNPINSYYRFFRGVS